VPYIAEQEPSALMAGLATANGLSPHLFNMMHTTP
jgi:hypothetical protein